MDVKIMISVRNEKQPPYGRHQIGAQRSGSGLELSRTRAVVLVIGKDLERETAPGLCLVVGVTGFEPAASTSQTSRATNCATPRYYFTF